MNEDHDRNFKANEYLDQETDKRLKEARKVTQIAIGMLSHTIAFICGALMF